QKIQVGAHPYNRLLPFEHSQDLHEFRSSGSNRALDLLEVGRGKRMSRKQAHDLVDKTLFVGPEGDRVLRNTQEAPVANQGLLAFELLHECAEQLRWDADCQLVAQFLHVSSGDQRMSGVKVSERGDELSLQPRPLLRGC